MTLTGLGGVGKSRLALAVGAALAGRGVAVGFCDATAVRGRAELAMALASALALDVSTTRVAPDVRPAVRESVEAELAVATALVRRHPHRLVLVLDNFEHLVDSAGSMLVELLARAPRLQLLVTSRVALMRPEELAIAVGPLPCEGRDSPALSLLIARARALPGSPWHDDRDALARLAVRLDGLPLALELAAARAPLTHPETLLRLIDEQLTLAWPGRRAADPRGGSRDAAVAWSFAEQSVEAREALTTLSVLGAPFDLELAAAAVGGERAQALEVLEALRRYSLLVVEWVGPSVRYRILETVRDYALAQADAERIERAHDAIAESLLSRVEPSLTEFSSDLPTQVLESIMRDRDLYLGIMRRGLQGSTPRSLTAALRVAIALVPAFQRAGFGPMACTLTAQLLARPGIEAVPGPVRARAAMVTVVALATGGEEAEVDRLVALILSWLADTESAQLGINLGAVAIVRYVRWDHPTLLVLAEAALRSPRVAANPELRGYALCAELSARRALGRAASTDELRLGEALSQLAPDHVATACLISLTRAFLAVHLGAPGAALAHVDFGLTRSGGTLKWFEALLRLERARALIDLERFAEADRELGEVCAALGGASSRAHQEALLDRALLALETGRFDLARALLDEAGVGLSTSFERMFHRALARALRGLTGDEVAGAEAPSVESGTVEDAAGAALAAVGCIASLGVQAEEVVRARRELTSASAQSFRARRAKKLLEAACALAAGEPSTVGLALDGSAVRVGPNWVDLSTRPLIRALLSALVEARSSGRPGVERERLGALLWPDERPTPESRDQRLFTAVTTLRRLGLEDALEAYAGGYRLAPDRGILRVATALWPGEDGDVRRGRGRGRPRRDT